MSQVCHACNESLPLTEFGQRRNGRPYTNCRSCETRRLTAYYRANPAARLRNGQRSRIRAARIAQGLHPGTHNWDHVGCTPAEFQAWIESQLESPWAMSNFGIKWTIDHITPANATQPQTFHYTNCRPMDRASNIRKGGSRWPGLVLSLLGSLESRAAGRSPPTRPERGDDDDLYYSTDESGDSELEFGGDGGLVLPTRQ